MYKEDDVPLASKHTFEMFVSNFNLTQVIIVQHNNYEFSMNFFQFMLQTVKIDFPCFQRQLKEEEEKNIFDFCVKCKASPGFFRKLFFQDLKFAR